MRKITKIALLALLSSIIFFSTNAQAKWCGQPVCPGDQVRDDKRKGFIENLLEITNSFLQEQLTPTIFKQMGQQSGLFGYEISADIKRTQIEIGNKTKVKTETHNRKILSDLAPTPEEACQVLTWQNYLNTETTEVTREKLTKDMAETGSKVLHGKAMSFRQKELSIYERLNQRNQNRTILPTTNGYLELDNLTKDQASDSLLAIDILTRTHGLSDYSTPWEYTSDKIQYTNSARNILVMNYNKYILSNPIYERIGFSNATSPGQKIPPSSPSYEDSQLEDIIEEGNSSAQEVKERNENISGLEDFASSPVEYTRISSPFTPERIHPVTGVSRAHKGVDLAAASGTPIYAPADGNFLKVGIDSAGINDGFGRMIIINHANGIQTWYGHLDGFAEGARSGGDVQKGDLIGYVGNTGISTGAHLHYEIRIDNEPIDPMGRFGISKMQATQTLIGHNQPQNEANDTDHDNPEGYKTVADKITDGTTLPSQLLRTKIINAGIGLESEMNKYRELEKMKVTMSIKILNKINNINMERREVIPENNNE